MRGRRPTHTAHKTEIMNAIIIVGGLLSSLISYLAMFYAGKIADGVQNKERGDLWVPISSGTAIVAYFFFFGFNMQHGFFASLGLALLTAVFGVWALLGISWLSCKALEWLIDLGDKLKNWSRRAVSKQKSQLLTQFPDSKLDNHDKNKKENSSNTRADFR